MKKKEEGKECNEKKKCFVIMPISDHDEYDEGHFFRVYNSFIKPAIEAVQKYDFEPVRADSEQLSHNIVDHIIKQLIESDVVICDLSTNNANVLYELGLRHAFDKPVVLLKDDKTIELFRNIFDVDHLRYYTYDSNLRIDNIEKAKEELTERIEKAFENQDDYNNSVVKQYEINRAVLKEKNIEVDAKYLLNEMADIKKYLNSLAHSKRNNLHEESGSFVSRINNINNGKRLIKYVDTVRNITPNDYTEGITNAIIKLVLKKGTRIVHRNLGSGIVIANNGGSIKVEFSEKEVQFSASRFTIVDIDSIECIAP